jgi:hypothetical protein
LEEGVENEKNSKTLVRRFFYFLAVVFFLKSEVDAVSLCCMLRVLLKTKQR